MCPVKKYVLLPMLPLCMLTPIHTCTDTLVPAHSQLTTLVYTAPRFKSPQSSTISDNDSDADDEVCFMQCVCTGCSVWCTVHATVDCVAVHVAAPRSVRLDCYLCLSHGQVPLAHNYP